jgi:Protein of unknown function (DUF1425)
MRSQVNTIVASLLLAAALAFAGCDTVKPPPAGRDDPLPIAAYPKIEISSGLNEYLVVEKPIVDPATPEKPMKVTVPVRSVADVAINTQYQFMFFDAKGRPVKNSPSGWRYANISARTQLFFEAGALDTDAVDWRLRIRSAR